MSDFPCRASIETRDYLEDQARNEIEWERSRGVRMESAIEAIRDVADLKQILNDEDLANFLAPIMQDFEQCMDEINGLVLEGKTLTLANLMRNVARLRTALIEMHMGEL
jgi:hypothetical protein